MIGWTRRGNLQERPMSDAFDIKDDGEKIP